MTQPQQATDWTIERIAELLDSRGYQPATSVSLIGSGQWSDCFAFTDQSRNLVVRIGRHGEDFRKDQIASIFARPGLPIPRVLEVAEYGHEFFAISERAFGEPLEQVADWQLVVAPLADLLEALRQTTGASITGWGHWSAGRRGEATSWRDFLLQVNQDPTNSRVHGWKQNLARYPQAAGHFERGYRQLESIIVDDVPRSVVHNDLFNRNAHLTAGVVTGVFDWGNSLVGDHLYDLALLCFWDPWFSHIDAQLLVDELHRRWEGTDAVPQFAERLRVCMLHAGLEHIGYHAFLNNEAEANRVAERMNTVVRQHWQ